MSHAFICSIKLNYAVSFPLYTFHLEKTQLQFINIQLPRGNRDEVDIYLSCLIAENNSNACFF